MSKRKLAIKATKTLVEFLTGKRITLEYAAEVLKTMEKEFKK